MRQGKENEFEIGNLYDLHIIIKILPYIFLYMINVVNTYCIVFSLFTSTLCFEIIQVPQCVNFFYEIIMNTGRLDEYGTLRLTEVVDQFIFVSS